MFGFDMMLVVVAVVAVGGFVGYKLFKKDKKKIRNNKPGWVKPPLLI